MLLGTITLQVYPKLDRYKPHAVTIRFFVHDYDPAFLIRPGAVNQRMICCQWGPLEDVAFDLPSLSDALLLLERHVLEDFSMLQSPDPSLPSLLLRFVI